jgi:transcriptional regulator with XRE-family HTH domain
MPLPPVLHLPITAGNLRAVKLTSWLRPPHTQDAVAKALGVSQGLVSHWLTGRRPVSAEHVLPLSAYTGFEVRPHDLRPDLYPFPSDGVPRERLAPPAAEAAA